MHGSVLRVRYRAGLKGRAWLRLSLPQSSTAALGLDSCTGVPNENKPNEIGWPVGRRPQRPPADGRRLPTGGNGMGTRGYSWVLRHSPGHNDFQGALEFADHLLCTKQVCGPMGCDATALCQAVRGRGGRTSRCEFAARKAAISSAESPGSVVTAASERG